MSKKPKKSRHRIPTLSMTSDPVDADYQAEVDASMERLRKRYERAEKALVAAEAKAERSREQAERLAAKQQEAERVLANRKAEEERLQQYIANIKLAAQNARVAAAREDLERKHQAAILRRNAQTELRRAEAKAIRQRELDIRSARAAHLRHGDEAYERRRELREIERLMMPGNYASSGHRGTRQARHNSGGGR